MESARVRAYINQAFQRSYGAESAAGYVDYLAIHDHTQVRAALGYRRAGDQALFLEQYLDQPIELALNQAFGREVGRERVVEIGNLAADNASWMITLWGRAANDLGGSSEIAVATLTAPLRRMFARIGVPLRELAAAQPARVGGKARDWGDYYRADPRICAASIAEGQLAIAAFLARRLNTAA